MARRPPSVAKRDANESEIFAELRAWGLSVCPMDLPADALIGISGKTYLVEIKTPKGKLTGPQERFLETWRGDHTILRTIDDATAFARLVKGLP